MKISEYEQAGKGLYEAFANEVADILWAALRDDGSIRVQVIQKRAKELSEVLKKLKDPNDDIQEQVKDLAGVRIVVYTNGDVARLNNSGVLRDNFEIDWDRTKLHFPVPKDGEVDSQFVGENYVVRLKDDRAALAEYKRFAGLCCEIQVQTILDHAWSETAHDTIYKSPKLDGVGAEQFTKLKERMDDIQEKYLRRAGYEFQQVLSDFERIVSGQRLMDDDILTAICNAPDNNLRVELLEQFATAVLPIIDDKIEAAAGIRENLLMAARNAQQTDTIPMAYPFGSMPGRTHQDVLEKILSILADIRYVDPAKTYESLVELHRIFPEPESRQKIVEATGELAKHSLPIWERYGPAVQEILLDVISAAAPDVLEETRPLVIQILDKCLEPQVTGTSSTSTTVTWETGSIVLSDRMNAVRDRAIEMLRDLFAASRTESDQTEIYRAMQSSTRTPYQGHSDDALLVRVLQDTAALMEFMTVHSDGLGQLLKQGIEHDAMFDYRRAKHMSGKLLENADVKSARQAVIAAADALRKRFNADEEFMIFKTLVGYESVFEYEWDEDDDKIDYSAKDADRAARAATFVAKVTETTAESWFDRLNGYASIESNDLAMFPQLGQFIAMVAEEHPAIGMNWLDRSEGKPLSRFIPGLLRGLYESDRDGVLKWIDAAIEKKTDLSNIAQFVRHAVPALPEVLEKVAENSIALEDCDAAFKVLEACAARPEEFGMPLARRLAIAIIGLLSRDGRYRWTDPLWVNAKRSGLLKEFDKAERAALFIALRDLHQIDFRAEEILAQFAIDHTEEVVDLFGTRLEWERTVNTDAFAEERYEAIPFDFSRLHKAMQHAGELLLQKALEWHRADPRLGKYKSARLVANLFPEPSPEFGTLLIDLANSGNRAAQTFVVDVTSNYDGAPIAFTVMKELVAVLPMDDELLGSVRAVLGATGVLHGEYGRRDALKKEREQISEWLSDSRELVVQFARKQIRHLDNAIKDEQKRAEREIAMRRLAYDEPLDDGEDIGKQNEA